MRARPPRAVAPIHGPGRRPTTGPVGQRHRRPPRHRRRRARRHRGRRAGPRPRPRRRRVLGERTRRSGESDLPNARVRSVTTGRRARRSSNSAPAITSIPTIDGSASTKCAAGRVSAAAVPTRPSTAAPAGPTARFRQASDPQPAASTASTTPMPPSSTGLSAVPSVGDRELLHRRRCGVDDQHRPDDDHRAGLRPPEQRRHELSNGGARRDRDHPRQCGKRISVHAFLPDSASGPAACPRRAPRLLRVSSWASARCRRCRRSRSRSARCRRRPTRFR